MNSEAVSNRPCLRAVKLPPRPFLCLSRCLVEPGGPNSPAATPSLSLPPIISRALYPSGSRLTGAGKLVSSFDWRGLYERYCTTPPEPETRPEPEEA